jgi:hypothetical protein
MFFPKVLYQRIIRLIIGFGIHRSDFFTALKEFLCVIKRSVDGDGKAFHIAALTLGEDGVEGEKTFARPGEAGHDDEFVTGQREINVFQIVLVRAFNDEVFHEG